TFTVPQLCEAAGLKNRDQAYSQIDRLRDYLVQEQLPAEGRRHRPLTLYHLTTDPEKREEFTREVLRYRPQWKPATDEAVAKELLERSNVSLDALEQSLAGARQLEDPASAVRQLHELDGVVATTETDIATALREYGESVSAESTPGHPAIAAKNRLQKVAQARQEMETELVSKADNKAKAKAAAEFAVQAAHAMADQIRDIDRIGVAGGRTLYQTIRRLSSHASPAI